MRAIGIILFILFWLTLLLLSMNWSPVRDFRLSDYPILRIIVGVLLAIFIGGSVVTFFGETFMNDDIRRERKFKKERQKQEKERLAKEFEMKREREKLEREEEQKKLQEQEYQKYLNLRKQIEQMPRYKRWQEDVMKKCGRKCQVGGEVDDLEIHHLDSLYSILQRNDITDFEQDKEKILKCRELWDVDNGIVLCKMHHDEMESSQTRQSLIE